MSTKERDSESNSQSAQGLGRDAVTGRGKIPHGLCGAESPELPLHHYPSLDGTRTLQLPSASETKPAWKGYSWREEGFGRGDSAWGLQVFGCPEHLNQAFERQLRSSRESQPSL